jgi:hypothetical protein
MRATTSGVGFLKSLKPRRVVGYLPAFLQDFTLYGFLTGWRKGGIKNLRWPDVAKQIIEDKTQERMAGRVPPREVLRRLRPQRVSAHRRQPRAG